MVKLSTKVIIHCQQKKGLQVYYAPSDNVQLSESDEKYPGPAVSGGHVKMVWVQLEESAPHMNIGG